VLPKRLQTAVDEVLKATDKEALSMLDNFEDERKVSKWAETIEQLPCERHLSPDPASWRCDKTGDDLSKTSLWLNLSDGFVGGGRRYFDGTGGNNSAVDHFEDMKAQGKMYPLAVKLGTITPQGADVYSYDEDDMVIVPPEKLADYLSHYGIDIMKMEKTEKSMQELELELNLNPAAMKSILGTDENKVPLHGAGYTGLINLGNSCYMNSVMQCIFSVPAFQNAFAANATDILDSFLQGNPQEVTTDFRAQMAKVGQGLMSGKYSTECPAEGEEGIAPGLFKQAVAKGHAEFLSYRQQDATEFWNHLLEKVSDEQKKAGALDPSTVFNFNVENRKQDNATQQVLYKEQPSNMLHLALPLEAATNMSEVATWNEKKAAAEAAGEKPNYEEAVIPDIPMAALFEAWASEEQMEFRKGTATSSQRFTTFPDFLVLHLRREVVNVQTWVPEKLDCTVLMEQELNLEHLRKAPGLQPGEMAMQDDPDAVVSQDPLPYDEQVVTMLATMGFSTEACKKAAAACNNDVEASSNWLMTHMEDPDFNAPFQAPGASAAPASAVDPALVAALMQKGTDFGCAWTKGQCEKALSLNGGDDGRATGWLFDNPGDPGFPEVAEATPEAPAAAAAEGGSSDTDGPGNYELAAFISHLGKNTGSGHYVCHIKKNGEWAIFNDTEVSKCESPPFQHGYMYLYQRKA